MTYKDDICATNEFSKLTNHINTLNAAQRFKQANQETNEEKEKRAIMLWLVHSLIKPETRADAQECKCCIRLAHIMLGIIEDKKIRSMLKDTPGPFSNLKDETADEVLSKLRTGWNMGPPSDPHDSPTFFIIPYQHDDVIIKLSTESDVLTCFNAEHLKSSKSQESKLICGLDKHVENAKIEERKRDQDDEYGIWNKPL